MGGRDSLLSARFQGDNNANMVAYFLLLLPKICDISEWILALENNIKLQKYA